MNYDSLLFIKPYPQHTILKCKPNNAVTQLFVNPTQKITKYKG